MLTLVAVLLFFLLFSFLLLFRSVFVFVFLSKLPTSTTPREFTFSQRTRLVPRCVYVLHCLLVCMYVCAACVYKTLCICEFGFQYIRCLVCRFAHYLSLSLSRDLCSQKTQHILCFVLLLSVRVRVFRRLADCCQLHILSVHTIMPCAVLCEFLASIC